MHAAAKDFPFLMYEFRKIHAFEFLFLRICFPISISPKLDVCCITKIGFGISDLDYIGIHYF